MIFIPKSHLDSTALIPSVSAATASGTETANLTAADISNSSGPDIALNCIPSPTSYLALTVCQICIWQGGKPLSTVS